MEEHVATEDLKKFETRYQTELNSGKVSSGAQFDYAWCLVRSKYPSDIRKGILLLEDLCQVKLHKFVLTHTYFTKINFFFRIETKVAKEIICSTSPLEMPESKSTKWL